MISYLNMWLTNSDNRESIEELSFALDKKVGLFAVDSFFEIARLAQLAKDSAFFPFFILLHKRAKPILTLTLRPPSAPSKSLRQKLKSI